MQPLVMQEWPFVVPRCPEWRVAEQARRGSAAHPLSQVKAPVVCVPMEQVGTPTPAPRCLVCREGCYLSFSAWIAKCFPKESARDNLQSCF